MPKKGRNYMGRQRGSVQARYTPGQIGRPELGRGRERRAILGLGLVWGIRHMEAYRTHC
jgi:hypothetical protein